MTALVIAEHVEGVLASSTLNTVAAAARLGVPLHLMVIGADCGSLAEAAAGLAGVSRVCVIEAPHYAAQTAENNAAAVLPHAREYSHILLPGNSFGKNLAPRLAATLDVAQVSDIVAIESADTFVRPIHAGNALATVKSSDAIKVLTVRLTAFETAGRGGSATVVRLAAGPDIHGARLVGRELSRSERPELASARIVVSGGRGMGSGDNYRKLLEPLADRLGAALGASRAAVDAGFVPNHFQVGQTGKIVAPELYFAVGISGAIQHLAGMKDARVIVAINKDEDAPIFQVADYGLVADLFESVPVLVDALGRG